MDGEGLPLGLIPLSTQPRPEPAPLAPLTPLSDSTGAGDSSDASRLPTVEGTPIEETEDEAAQTYVNEKQCARVIRRREFKAERALNAEQNGERLNSTSRQEHAHRRPRGPHGRFLGAGETPPVLAKPVMRAAAAQWNRPARRPIPPVVVTPPTELSLLMRGYREGLVEIARLREEVARRRAARDPARGESE